MLRSLLVWGNFYTRLGLVRGVLKSFFSKVEVLLTHNPKSFELEGFDNTKIGIWKAEEVFSLPISNEGLTQGGDANN